MARVVVPDIPHHITQRGNRRMEVFFCDADRRAYLAILDKMSREHGVAILGYCLMSNHVHLLAVPKKPDSLACGIGWTHWRYTRRINFRENWRGYLWQGRFHSCALDAHHAALALRYIEQNPVRAGLVSSAEEWPWSSAQAHLGGPAEPLLTPTSIVSDAAQWSAFLRENADEFPVKRIRRHTRTGRPCGSPRFVQELESRLKRPLAPSKPGPKRKTRKATAPDTN